MKKTYITPELRVETVVIKSLIADSLNSLNVNGGGPVSKGNAWSKEDNGWDVWDEDDFRDE
ncbi:MAG: hypothetical protein J5671_05230 [Bacteroidaceae bacterium]|nr:hypothetical protein [Bacteroidaceae bacterium]